MSEFVETMSTWEFDLLPALPAEYALKPWYIRWVPRLLLTTFCSASD